MKKREGRAGKLARGEDNLLVLQRTPVQFLEAAQGCSQLPVPPVLGTQSLASAGRSAHVVHKDKQGKATHTQNKNQQNQRRESCGVEPGLLKELNEITACQCNTNFVTLKDSHFNSP